MRGVDKMKYSERCNQAIVSIETALYITDTKSWIAGKDYAEKVRADLLATGNAFDAELAGMIDPYQLSRSLYALKSMAAREKFFPYWNKNMI